MSGGPHPISLPVTGPEPPMCWKPPWSISIGFGAWRVSRLFLDSVSWLAFAEEDPVRAMTALGAANLTRARVGLVRWATVAILLESTGMAAEAETPELAEARRVGGEMSPHDAISLPPTQPHHELATA